MESRGGIRSSKSEHEYYYSVVIYKRKGKNRVYDVELTFSESYYIVPPAGRGREIAHILNIATDKFVYFATLTCYMKWKFQHCQYSDDRNDKPVAKKNKFTHIHNDIDWIKSIINVETDYHLGEAKCMKPENSAYTKEYLATQFSGYGSQFCDVKEPQNNISNSRLAKMFSGAKSALRKKE